MGTACATFTEVSVVDNESLGLLAVAASCPVSLNRTLVDSSSQTAQGRRGWGLAVQNSALTARESAVMGCFEVGVFVYGATGAATLERFSLSGTQAPGDGKYSGIGLLGTKDTRTVVIASTVRTSQGVGLLFDGAAASVFESTVSDNLIGIATMGASTLEVLEQPPTALGASQVAVETSTEFVNNPTRVGSGNFPLPPPF